MFDWAPIKKVVLEEIYKGVLKLESFNILNVPDYVVFKGGEHSRRGGEDGDPGRVDWQGHWRDQCQKF